METLTDTKLFRARLQVMELPLPWWLGVRGAFGFQTRCKFRTFTEAHAHSLKWVAAGWDADNLTVNHFESGPELWDIEWQINATRYRRQIEQGKLKPSAQAVQVLQEQICRLYEEAFLLCEIRGWAVAHGVKERGLVRFEVTPRKDFSHIWEKNLPLNTLHLAPKTLLRGDRVSADGLAGVIKGLIGSPAEGVSILWDGSDHPVSLLFKDAGEIKLLSRSPRMDWLEEAG